MSGQNKITKQGGRNANRARPLPPDVTARNLAYEKQRRQTFNDDLVNLARLVPSLSQTRRLSKVLIVNESTRHLRQRRSLCIDAARDVRELLVENDRLASELNALRTQVGGPAMPRVERKPVTEAMAQLMDVENEAAGEFPEGFGESWAGRSSPSSRGKPARSEKEASPLPEDTFTDHTSRHPTQPPHQNFHVSSGDHKAPTRNLQQEVQKAWDTGLLLNLDDQPEPPLGLGPEVFASPEVMAADHMPTDMPGLYFGSIGASSMNILPASWMEYLHLDTPRSADIANGRQGGIEGLEDLWNFWVGGGDNGGSR